MSEMTPEEILQRAREAAAEAQTIKDAAKAVLAGKFDDHPIVRAVCIALERVNEPLVDPEIMHLREIVAAYLRDAMHPTWASSVDAGDYDGSLRAALPAYRKAL